MSVRGGESRTQIGEVVGLTAQITGTAGDFDALSEAVTAVFQIQDVNPDSDPREIIRSIDSMVKNNLASSYRDAADILVTGFQIGADRGDDLLDTFNEYGETFEAMGLTGKEALNLINNSLKSGVDNSDRVAANLQELDTRLRSFDDEAVNSAIEKLSLTEAREAWMSGDLPGAEFLTEIRDALLAVEDPAERWELAVALMGTQVEDFKNDSTLSFLDVTDNVGNMAGKAEAASNTINDTLGVKLTSLWRFLTNELSQAFNDVFDIDGLIQTAKDSIDTFFTEVGAGQNILEAAEIAVGIPGLENAVQSFEMTATDLLLGFLELSSAIISAIDKIPGVDASNVGVNNALARVGGLQFQTQMGFFSDEDSPQQLRDTMADAVDDAIARGVDQAVVESGASEAILREVERLADAGASYEEIIDVMRPTLTALFAREASGDIDTFAGTFNDQIMTIFNTAMEQNDFAMMEMMAEFRHIRGTDTDRQRLLDVTGQQRDMFMQNPLFSGSMLDRGESSGGVYGGFIEGVTEIETSISEAAEEITNFEGTAKDTFGRIGDDAGKMSQSVLDETKRIATDGDGDFEVLHTSFSGNIDMMIGEVDRLTLALGEINNMELTPVINPIVIDIPSGAGSNTTITQNNVFNNNNGAAAAASNQQTANQLRGFAP